MWKVASEPNIRMRMREGIPEWFPLQNQELYAEEDQEDSVAEKRWYRGYISPFTIL